MRIDSHTSGTVRLAYVVSHPIQYQAPLLRRIAQEPGIDLTVFFGSDFSVRGYADQGFGGVQVKWDLPLLDGYRHEFLPTLIDRASAQGAQPISRGVFRRLRRSRFDCLWVHGYSSPNAMQAIFAANLLGIPVLVRAEPWLADRERSQLTLAAKQLFFRALGHLIDGALAIGSLNTQYWRHYLGPEFPVFLMPYAVDNAYFQQRSAQAAPSRAALQASLGLDPARPIALFASKLQTRKRCGDLIDAFLRLPPISPAPYLLIAGDGEQRQALEQRVQDAGRTADIRFLGFRNQSELPSLFDLATVFVLPSQHEPWGLIVNEVMNAGRAVILSTDVGSQPDLITDGVEGCVFPPGDIPALTAALHRVLSQPELAAAMGRNALQRIRSWSFEQDIAGLRQALTAVTGKRLAGE